MSPQRAFFVDATKCVNCRTCEIACKDVKGAGASIRLRKVRTFESGAFPSTVVNNVSMACNHCEDPLCAKHCPAKAYSKRADGIVLHDKEKCIGCRYCMWMCPYGAPQFDAASGTIRKCDLCAGELDAGGEPTCVSACPTRAIDVRWLSDAECGDSTMSVCYLPDPALTKPASRYIVRKEARND